MVSIDQVLNIIHVLHVLSNHEGEMAVVVDLVELHRVGKLGGNPLDINDISQLVSVSNEEANGNLAVSALEGEFRRGVLTIMVLVSSRSIVKVLESLGLHNLAEVVETHEGSARGIVGHVRAKESCVINKWILSSEEIRNSLTQNRESATHSLHGCSSHVVRREHFIHS